MCSAQNLQFRLQHLGSLNYLITCEQIGCGWSYNHICTNENIWAMQVISQSCYMYWKELQQCLTCQSRGLETRWSLIMGRGRWEEAWNAWTWNAGHNRAERGKMLHLSPSSPVTYGGNTGIPTCQEICYVRLLHKIKRAFPETKVEGIVIILESRQAIVT